MRTRARGATLARRVCVAAALLAALSAPSREPVARAEPPATLGFENPVSAYLDLTTGYWIVSSLGGVAMDARSADGNGFLSKIWGLQPVTEFQARALDAPIGARSYAGRFVVADRGDVRVIDPRTRAEERIPVPGAVFLNGLVIDEPTGDVYLSDTVTDTIYRLPAGADPEVLVQSPDLAGPAGLFLEADSLVVASMGAGFDPATFRSDEPGRLLRVSLDDRSISPVTGPVGSLIGVARDGEDYLVSDFWAGELLRVDESGSVSTVLRLVPTVGAFAYDPWRRMAAVPIMAANVVLMFNL